MTEEEKNAIEILENLSEYGLCYNITEEHQEVMKTILNLIIKLRKENEKYKYLYQKALDNTVKSDKENIGLKRQIDLMALAILNYDDQLVINRYKNIDEVKETFKDLAKEKGE